MHSTRVLQSAALTVIAIVLALDFWTAQIRPHIYLRDNQDELSQLSIQCELAKLALEESASNTQGIDESGLRQLQASIRVDLVSCHEREKLRQHLLSKGVSFSSITLVELNAKEDQAIPIYRLVDRYAVEP